MRTRSRKAAVAAAAAAAALALVPASSAVAGTGPAPSPDKRAAKAAPSIAAGNPNSARAQAAGVCSDAYQIGSTGYVKRGSETIASVKQFYSPNCAENYSYLYVWQGFRDKNPGQWDISVSVYSSTQDEVLGTKTWKNSEAAEFWSNGTDTVNECTTATGSLRLSGNPLPWQAASSKRC